MKYLKKFNESIGTDEMKNFCDMYLSYLYDDTNFSTYVYRENDSNGDESDILNITFRDILRIYRPFFWSDVKDYIIPFLTVLNDKYKILDIKIDLNIQTISSLEKLPDNTVLKYITIRVCEYKKPSLLDKLKLRLF